MIVRRNQIHLGDRPLRQNKAFLRAVYHNPELENARKWFDKLDRSATLTEGRQVDRRMTLDSYLRLMTSSFYVLLQPGSPCEDDIRCCAGGRDRQGIDRYLWVVSSFSEKNYGIISELFRKIYKEELDSLPILE